MGYNTDSSGTTLNAEDRSAEAKRILDRLRDCDTSKIGAYAQFFLTQQLEILDQVGSVDVTIKQLFWLRDISGKVD